MEYVKKENDLISKIALGAADFGTKTDKETSFLLMDEFLSAGGNAIDTGRAYCYWVENGANASESTIGEFMRQRKNRSKIFLATKGGHPPVPHFEISRINETELTKDVNESLYYLKTDYLDVFYLHRDDESKPVSEIMPVLDKFVKQGKTRYIGASNWKSERILQANEFALKNGLTPFSFSQIMWSYAEFNTENLQDKTQVIMNDNEYEFYKNHKEIQLTAYSSQAQGFYSVLNENGVENLPDFYKKFYLNDCNLKRFAEIKAFSKESGLSPTAAGLLKLIENELSPVALIGGKTRELLKDSLSVFGVNRQ